VALFAALCVFAATPAFSRVLFIDQFPHFQTFDNFDNCYYDGTCYENRCDNLLSGWYSPVFRSALPDPPSIRHWWVIDQQTPSNWDSSRTPVDCDNLNTGPCADHTSGVPGGGKYLYAESSACYNIIFHVVSPTFLFNNTGAVISFWYYIFGVDVDITTPARISIDLSINNGSWTEFFAIQGGQGERWNYARIPIDDFIGNNATHAEPTPVTFRFVARTAINNANDNFFSDVAIDDVYVTQNGAPNSSEPYIEPNETRPPPIVPSPIVEEEGGDGLTDEEIIGIVIGIVGGACCLCCLLCLCLLALLLIISPRKPPDQQGGGGGL
jgi:hypothetical protein